MDVRPTPEQRELETAATRLAERLGPGTVGDLDDADRRARLDSAIEQAGWRELRTGAAGAPLASGVEAAIVGRCLARRACDTAYVGPLLAHDLARRAGVRVEASTIGVTRSLEGLGDAFGVDAAGSSAALGLDGSTLTSSSIATVRRGVDLTRPVATLDASPSAVTGALRLTSDDVTSWTALAITLSAADLVGSMEGTLALATDYAKDRRQYNAPIGSYQAVQHLLAEGAALVEGSISTLLHAAWAVDAQSPSNALAAAAVAKAYAARAARTVCETSIQVHGGIGNTWECMAHVFLRRCLLSTQLFGDDAAHLALLASHRWGATDGLR